MAKNVEVYFLKKKNIEDCREFGGVELVCTYYIEVYLIDLKM
jgi:hypothetical protein